MHSNTSRILALFCHEFHNLIARLIPMVSLKLLVEHFCDYCRLFLFPYVEDLRMRILLMFNTISSIRIKFLYTLILPSGTSFFNIIIVEDNCWKLMK
ncbi:hypothetical protein Tco_0657937 [Tanacetum coccineum]